MSTTQTEPLILDLVEWLAPGPRPYDDVSAPVENWLYELVDVGRAILVIGVGVDDDVGAPLEASV